MQGLPFHTHCVYYETTERRGKDLDPPNTPVSAHKKDLSCKISGQSQHEPLSCTGKVCPSQHSQRYLYQSSLVSGLWPCDVGSWSHGEHPQSSRPARTQNRTAFSLHSTEWIIPSLGPCLYCYSMPHFPVKAPIPTPPPPPPPSGLAILPQSLKPCSRKAESPPQLS